MTFPFKKKEKSVAPLPEVQDITDVEESGIDESEEEEVESKDNEDLDIEEERLKREIEIVNKKIEDIKSAKKSKIRKSEEEPEQNIEELLGNFAYRLNRIEHFLRLDY
jgi:hypothetical protein